MNTKRPTYNFFLKIFATLCILFLLVQYSYSQVNSVARYEIDAKRMGVRPIDKDALPRSREFIRLDSTYYVGYMYEGMYKAEKSSDFIGFKNAIPTLRKAFILLQKDYGKGLKELFSSPQAYMLSMNRYVDFLQISNSLKECYDNLEMPDSVMWVMNKVGTYRFPKDHLGATTTKAWTYHRNRFFTSQKFSFLKNSVEENEKMAFYYCFKALKDIQVHKQTNDLWFGPNQAELDRMNVYHYLALLYNYNKKYDSSEYYYKLLARGGSVSWNNYGNMKHELGEFSVAHEYFARDKYKYTQKTLREPYYFLPMLDIYAGRTKEAMSLCKEAITDGGSTPGFGWYNIALSRSYLYDGQLDSAEYALQKAANFKEIHIGTTLNQSQYNFTIDLLKLQLLERKYALIKFQNVGWWYSPKAWYQLVSLKLQKILLEYILINQLSVNPERDRTVYDLFCGESTTTYDEAFYLLKDFSPSYFIKKYDTYIKNDKRISVQRYFQLFKHEMEWENGDKKIANTGYKNMIKNIKLDTANEKLLLARLYENLSIASEKDDNGGDYNFYNNALFEEYPQLIPFSPVTIKMKLISNGVDDENTKKVIAEMKDCNIQWVNNEDGNTPKANIFFIKKGSKYEVTINVKSGSNMPVVNNEKMIFQQTEGVGKELALRLFGKSGAMVF